MEEEDIPKQMKDMMEVVLLEKNHDWYLSTAYFLIASSYSSIPKETSQHNWWTVHPHYMTKCWNKIAYFLRKEENNRIGKEVIDNNNVSEIGYRKYV